MLHMWGPDASSPKMSSIGHQAATVQATGDITTTTVYTTATGCQTCEGRLEQNKMCIWVKYRQNKFSALIDTGSDITIAGEDIARRMGWTIHAHPTKKVNVANNDTMSISGAAQVTLNVGGRKVESEILISPDYEGFILGFDWIRQQGSFGTHQMHGFESVQEAG